MEKNEYLKKFKQNGDLFKINGYIDSFSNLNILVIGDIIIDQYVFVTPKGRAIKDPILSVEYDNHETYAGGILAIANHLSTYVNKINIVTIIGDTRTRLDFIKKNIKDNIELTTFTKQNSPTVMKKRFIDEYKNNKLFKIEYINDEPIKEELSNEIVTYLDEELPKYDLVIVGDFGHGFINKKIREIIQKRSNYLAINVQSNSANMGYNYVNHYKTADFVTLNQSEVRMPLMRRFEKIEKVMHEFHNKFGFDHFLVTLGKKGTASFFKNNIYEVPILLDNIVDTVGAGDALFAISSLFTYVKADPKLIPFIANCAGGIKANYMGNKESVTKDKLINFVEEL